MTRPTHPGPMEQFQMSITTFRSFSDPFCQNGKWNLPNGHFYFLCFESLAALKIMKGLDTFSALSLVFDPDANKMWDCPMSEEKWKECMKNLRKCLDEIHRKCWILQEFSKRRERIPGLDSMAWFRRTSVGTDGYHLPRCSQAFTSLPGLSRPPYRSQTKVLLSMGLTPTMRVTSNSPHSQVVLEFLWVCISKMESHTNAAQPMCSEAWIAFKQSLLKLLFLPSSHIRATQEMKLVHRDAVLIEDKDLSLAFWTLSSFVATLSGAIGHVGV